VARVPDEALRICREHRETIHLLLSDVIMPGLSGPELGRRAAPHRPQMRVLYMSGYSDDMLTQHGPGLAYLQKPFTPGDLTARVREILNAPAGRSCKHG